MSDSEKLNLDSIIGRLLEGGLEGGGRAVPAVPPEPWPPARPGSGARAGPDPPGASFDWAGTSREVPRPQTPASRGRALESGLRSSPLSWVWGAGVVWGLGV
jgi:hypothetical protein